MASRAPMPCGLGEGCAVAERRPSAARLRRLGRSRLAGGGGFRRRWSEFLPSSPAVATTAPSPSGCSIAGGVGLFGRWLDRASPSVSISTSTQPIAIRSPTSPASLVTVPATGRFHFDRGLVGHHVGELLVFLDAVADLDVPGDDLGLGNAFADVGQLELIGRHYDLHHFLERVLEPDRAGEIDPFIGVRIGRVPAGDALDRGFEVVEAALLDQRGELGAEAAGARRFLDDEAAAGLLDRSPRSSRCRAGSGCAGR